MIESDSSGESEIRSFVRSSSRISLKRCRYRERHTCRSSDNGGRRARRSDDGEIRTRHSGDGRRPACFSDDSRQRARDRVTMAGKGFEIVKERHGNSDSFTSRNDDSEGFENACHMGQDSKYGLIQCALCLD